VISSKLINTRLDYHIDSDCGPEFFEVSLHSVLPTHKLDTAASLNSHLMLKT